MSLRNRLALLIALSTLGILAGCGSSSTKATPPPTGGFSASNLKGTYVFSVVGSDNLGDFLGMAGTFAADGSGNLTGGSFDVNNPNGAGLFQALAVGSNSRYTVTADGRGTATINTPAGTFGFDFVLSSSESGQITEFDSGGSGSGTLDLQSTVAQADIAGSYAFSFTGTSGIGTSLCGLSNGNTFVLPFATVGAFTLDASGNITTGVEDFNNNCISAGLSGLTITGGSVNLSTGTATISSNAGTFNFDVFPVTANYLKFIETDPVSVMSGNAYTQSSTIASGASVFTVAGFDASIGGPFTAAGVMDTDGNGTVIGGSEDYNDAGNVASVSNFTGSYTALIGGRSVLTLNSFVNGSSGLGCTGCQYAIYPSSGGLQIMEIDNGGTTNGVAYAQAASPTLASGQGYGMNLAGVNTSSEEDDIAEFTNNNGSFTGVIDFSDQGTTTFGRSFSATYTASGTATGRGVVTPGSNAFNLVTYVVDSSTVLFVETDTNPPQVGIGSFVVQNASAKANAAVNHLAVLRIKPGLKKALKRTNR